MQRNLCKYNMRQPIKSYQIVLVITRYILVEIWLEWTSLRMENYLFLAREGRRDGIEPQWKDYMMCAFRSNYAIAPRHQ